jgi:hypothetical protein
MDQYEFKISNLDLANWGTALRNLPTHEERSRALDALWWGQLASKGWLVNELEKYTMPGAPENIYIFGGWIGTLASMLFNSSIHINKIRSIDLDPWCESVADTLNKTHEMNDWRFKAVTADMATYEYQTDIRPTIVINTSAEHVTQAIYDRWYDRIPSGTLVAVQSNDFQDLDTGEHIRCSTNLEEFKIMNKVENEYYCGELPTNQYTRYMAIWRKY